MKQKSQDELQLVALVGAAYEAGLDASLWPSFLDLLARAVNAQAGTIFIHDFSGTESGFAQQHESMAAFVGFDEAALNAYGSHYGNLNVWQRNEDLLGEGKTVTSSGLYPDTLLKRTEFYGDWLRKYDFFYSLGGVVEKRERLAVKLSLLRSESCGIYDSTEMRVIDVLMPHLKSAVLLHRKLHGLAALASAATSALDALSFGIVLLDVRGFVLHANAAAWDIVCRTSALRIGRGGALTASTHAATARLHRLVHSAIQASKGEGAPPPLSPLELPHAKGQSVQAQVVPMSAREPQFGLPASAAVFLRDPASKPPEIVALLRSTYGMSDTEARLAEALINGMSLKEFASMRGTSMHTVRSQLRAVSNKIGVRRQADIVRTILTGPAILHWREPGV